VNTDVKRFETSLSSFRRSVTVLYRSSRGLKWQKTRMPQVLLRRTRKIMQKVVVPLMRVVTIATYYVSLSDPPGKRYQCAVSIQDHKEKHKGQEVEVETMRLLLECLVEEQNVRAVQERPVDQYLTTGNFVKGLKEVVRMVLEEGESEGAVLRVNEEGPKEEEGILTNLKLGPPTLCPWDLLSRTSSTSGTSGMC